MQQNQAYLLGKEGTETIKLVFVGNVYTGACVVATGILVINREEYLSGVVSLRFAIQQLNCRMRDYYVENL